MAEEKNLIDQIATQPAKEEGKKGKPVRGVKKKVKKNVPIGIIHIQSTFNNTIVSVTDPRGNTLAWSSGGSRGFKGSRKGTPFAAQLAVEDAVKKAMTHGLKQVTVLVKGPGAGRDQALRMLQKTGVSVKAIYDVTPLPHNGCRPPKKRRV
ncbi:MAG: 30S ribosomal protein S11 [Deltaproteobacteria bacterium]|nr:30S ribosomal protein S11 [Deltaproteobacteria bacterium]